MQSGHSVEPASSTNTQFPAISLIPCQQEFCHPRPLSDNVLGLVAAPLAPRTNVLQHTSKYMSNTKENKKCSMPVHDKLQQIALETFGALAPKVTVPSMWASRIENDARTCSPCIHFGSTQVQRVQLRLPLTQSAVATVCVSSGRKIRRTQD